MAGLNNIDVYREADDIDIGFYLKRFLKPGQSQAYHYRLFSERRGTAGKSNYYSASFVSGLVSPAIYLDAEYNFLLVVRKNLLMASPIALIGFDFDCNSKTLTIQQIQGSPFVKDYLSAIRWERMLVAIVVDWSKSYGVRLIEIISSEQSPWYKLETGGVRERMYMHYDVTAKRSGFRLNEETGRYRLPLSE
ncbi:MAG: hypothetical protein KGI72_01155 [Patescibacteria group bacterium]|nr:hypothetical protein [Patescibacteria group bacterium]MDE2015119.1 hypothetical protein [Patescibacteria group bacterium]